MKKSLDTGFIVKAALIAALYVVFTLVPPLNAISFSFVQFRISEALMLLCAINPAAIFGVTIGCLISNILGSGNPFDIVFGTLATFLAAISTWGMRKTLLKYKFLAPIPTIIFNSIIVGLYLPFLISNISMVELFSKLVNSGASQFDSVVTGATGVAMCMTGVFIGETVVCYIIGIPVLILLEKRKF